MYPEFDGVFRYHIKRRSGEKEGLGLTGSTVARRLATLDKGREGGGWCRVPHELLDSVPQSVPPHLFAVHAWLRLNLAFVLFKMKMN